MKLAYFGTDSSAAGDGEMIPIHPGEKEEANPVDE